MQIRASKKELKSALIMPSKTINPKAPISILSMLKISISNGIMSLCGYDLDTGAVVTIPVEAGLDSSDVEFCVDSKKFNDIIAKSAEDEITIDIEIEKLTMTLKSGKSKCKIAITSADNYPSVPDIEAENQEVITIPGATLAEMIRQTNFSVSVTDNKPVLQGECFTFFGDSLDVAACDGYRLAVRNENITTNNEHKFVVKADALKNLMAMIGDTENVDILPTKKHVMFRFGNKQLFSRLLEGDFYNYKKSVPNSFSTEAIVYTKELIESLERFMLLIDDKNKAPCRCTVGDGKFELSLKNANGEMTDTIECDLTGDKFEIGFNCKFMTDALKASEADKVRINFNGGLQPMTITPLDGNDYIFLVLPVRLRVE